MVLGVRRRQPAFWSSVARGASDRDRPNMSGRPDNRNLPARHQRRARRQHTEATTCRSSTARIRSWRFAMPRPAPACAPSRRKTSPSIEPDFRQQMRTRPTRVRVGMSAVSRARPRRSERQLVLPVGPVPQYAIAASMINRLRIDCKRAHLQHDERRRRRQDRARRLVRIAPPPWGQLFSRIDPELHARDQHPLPQQRQYR